MLAEHYGPDCPAALVYHASWPDEKIIRGTLGDVARQIEAAGIARTAIFLVGRTLKPARRARVEALRRVVQPRLSQGDRAVKIALVSLSNEGARVAAMLAGHFPEQRDLPPHRRRGAARREAIRSRGRADRGDIFPVRGTGLHRARGPRGASHRPLPEAQDDRSGRGGGRRRRTLGRQPVGRPRRRAPTTWPWPWPIASAPSR